MGLCAGLPEESSSGFELCGKRLLGLKENYWKPRGLNSRRYLSRTSLQTAIGARQRIASTVVVRDNERNKC